MSSLLVAVPSIGPAGRLNNQMAALLADGYSGDRVDAMGLNLAANLRRLREARGASQRQMAKLSGIPRPTWASLESGGANPTLSVLARVASVLQVSIEELIGPPRTAARLFRGADRRTRRRQGARLSPLLPETIAGLDLSRFELDPGGRMVGIPHTPGTREYLTCESGRIELVASGERWELQAGDSLVFRGDQRHVYSNPDPLETALAISVVCFAPPASAADR